jgi:REP element-mobilizing transposase RayT
VFATADDRYELNGIVAQVMEKYDARAHAFCWMTNHLHLLAQIKDVRLGKIMQLIAQRYARHRHKQLGTTGHLFERRYRAWLVDTDAYFIALLRYIHRNPVRAGMVGRRGLSVEQSPQLLRLGIAFVVVR